MSNSYIDNITIWGELDETQRDVIKHCWVHLSGAGIIRYYGPRVRKVQPKGRLLPYMNICEDTGEFYIRANGDYTSSGHNNLKNYFVDFTAPTEAEISLFELEFEVVSYYRKPTKEV